MLCACTIIHQFSRTLLKSLWSLTFEAELIGGETLWPTNKRKRRQYFLPLRLSYNYVIFFFWLKLSPKISFFKCFVLFFFNNKLFLILQSTYMFCFVFILWVFGLLFSNFNVFTTTWFSSFGWSSARKFHSSVLFCFYFMGVWTTIFQLQCLHNYVIGMGPKVKRTKSELTVETTLASWLGWSPPFAKSWAIWNNTHTK
jgi:hypothetical protein